MKELAVLKEDDNSFVVGLISGVVFSILFIMCLTMPEESQDGILPVELICLGAAVLGWLLVVMRQRCRMIFTDEGVTYIRLFGKPKNMKYEEISQFMCMKQGFFLYNQDGDRMLEFSARLERHPEVEQIIRSHGIEVNHSSIRSGRKDREVR
ncbi:MAG: hypothetical protein LKK26_06390 [Solobacterium sp.]|jgi:hypothetical protein|uniref:hypothetical protein n=1 Tax=Stecheria intestinalis TaxID=2606630 RepID=UPI0023F56EBA|nr:hypothetical protein [Stecheria intestinalis]MCI2154358.1 hypothetical protein [Solobacterium sp.]MDD5881057.1 hypothetical protein [Stecheria intestinalis]MDY3233065.1 hypothetical protein [Erysipelotrichaceae bacterium]